MRKPKNLGLMHEMHEKRGIKNTYQRRKAGSRPKCKRVRWLEWGKGVWRERKIFSFKREVRKWKPDCALGIYIEKRISMDWGAIEICQALNVEIWICRGVVENLSTAKVPWWIEILSKIYQPDGEFLDGSRSYQDILQKARWIEYAIKSIEKRSPKGSIDRKLLWICRKVV